MQFSRLARISLFFVPLLFSCAARADNSFSSEQIAFVEKFEQKMQADVGSKVPGFALAIVLDGRIAHLKGYGVKKVNTAESVDENTAFRIASVSKTFASAATAVLIKKKILDWDSKVTPYLKNVGFKNESYAQQLRLHHLLSHSTGLIPHTYTNLINQNTQYDEILKLIKKVNFVCAPGECYGYQNVIYSLVGDVVEYVTLDSYESFVNKNLFVPLRMDNASLGLDSFISNKNAAAPHVRRGGHWKPVKVKPNFYMVPPAAGVNASIADMSKWLLAQLGKRQDVLSKKVLDAMHAKRIKTTKRQSHYHRWKHVSEAHYGLGWRVFDYAGQANFVHHGGFVQGFRAEMVFSPELDMGMVVLTNAQGPYINRAVPDFLDLYIEHGLHKAKGSIK